MMALFWSLLGILSGAFALQAPVNSQLARGLGFSVAAAFSFLSGAGAILPMAGVGLNRLT